MDNVKFEGGKLVPADAGKPASITVELQSPYVLSRGTGTAEMVSDAPLHRFD